MQQRLSVALFGAPGSGKGTQASLIAEKYRFEHISTGELFRKEMAMETPLGLKAKQIVEQGLLCPDDITLNMLYNRIQNVQDAQGVILDGVPRTMQQAHMMNGIGFDHVIPISFVIYLNINKEQVINRIMKRAELLNRSDDNPAAIETRIESYARSTEPLKSYYLSQNILFEVDGMQSIDSVFADVCKVIDAHL